MFRHALLAATLAASPFTSIAADEPPFTIVDVLSFPHPTELVAAPVGDRVAWVSEQAGVRNVWMAEAPDWEGQALTAFDDDDGQAISGLAFTSDGASLLFIRGGSPNRQGELPNPVSDPVGVEQMLWIASVDGTQAPRALLMAGAYEAFPDGERVIFIRDKQLWITTLDGSAAANKPTYSDGLETPMDEGAGTTENESTERASAAKENARQLFSVRRGVASFSIAPDGRMIAFVSDRGDYAFVGVYDLNAETLTWLDPSVDHDSSPTWAPDSSAVAFLRIPSERQILPFMPRREGLPWSVRVGNPANGQTREVFRAEEGSGSVFGAGYWFVGDRLWWGSDDRIIFPWEKTGWLHLWSVAAEGGEPVNLTPGRGEVQYALLSPDGRHMMYASNHNDPESRHLWQSPVTGGRPERLTHGEGIEWAPQRTASSGTLVYLGSDALTPARPQAMVDDQARAIGPAPPNRFSTAELVQPELVRFSAADGMTIPGQLFSPPERCGAGPHPGLLYFHGGSRRQMMLGFHPRRYYSNAYAFNQTMASRCFVVVSVNFRSGVGYGLDFREALDYGAQGASEYRDVVGAGLYLAARTDVDPNRIGLWGGSYGGYLTALGLARASHLFAAGVDIHGVHDWNAVINNFEPTYDPASRDEFARLAFASSPMSDLSNWTSPVLLIHGDDDRNVPFSESVNLAEALRRQGTPVNTLVFPDEVHGFLLHRNWLAAFRASAQFLERELQAND